MTEKHSSKRPPADETAPETKAAGSGSTEDPDEHLSDLTGGIGCVEVWEHLSEQRSADE